MFRPVSLLATPIAPTAVSRYSGFLRSTLRVRWMFHRFRSGPQSDSLTPSQDSGNPLGSRGFYFRAYLSSLPPRAADILTVRFGQLTVEGLSPSKIRSLVGCSHTDRDISTGRYGGDYDPSVLSEAIETIPRLNDVIPYSQI